MATNKTPSHDYIILVDEIPYHERYTTPAQALKAAIKLSWTAERKIEIVKVVQSINVEEAL